MREIPLTKGKVALVDDEDFELFGGLKWHLSGSGYAVRRICLQWKAKPRKNKTIHLHREIIKASPGEFVDHINVNKLDNRRSNLRLCSFKENRRNNKITGRNKSGFKGVRIESSPSRRVKEWRAEITVNNKNIYLGNFYDRRSAALAYDQAAEKHFGRFANLNFPRRHQL